MKKVLFVFSHPAPYKVHFLNLLAQHVHLTVVFERQLGSYSKKQYQNNPPFAFQTLELGGLTLGKENHYSRSLIRHLKQNSYDLIIMNGYSSFTEMMTIRYLIQHRIPYYLYVNGGVIRRENLLKKRLKRFLISHAKGYFSPSAFVDPYLIHYGANPKHIYHYPYATIFADDVLKQPLSRKAKMALRDRYQLSHDHLTISVGQFIPRKNFLALLHFWKTLPTSFHLLLVGDGPLLRRYEVFIRKNRMHNVTLKPFQPKYSLLEMYQASDAFILLSKEDIYGHVVNEALSQGLPVMTTFQTFSGKQLLNETIGQLVDVHQPASWRAAFEALVRIENIQPCLDKAKENTFETMVEAHRIVLKEILQP